MGVSVLNDRFFSRLEIFELNLKKDLRGFFGGKHLVSTYGQTVEFSDYRDYQLGDDIRRIDWNLYSRFEKYFIKLFTDERQMHVHIFLDASASMGKDNPKKAAFALQTAAALGYLAVHNMDKVSFGLIKGDKLDNPYGTIIGKNAFFRAISDLQNLEFDGESDISKAILSSTNNTSGDGLAVIISDFFTENDYKKAVDYMVYKKRQVLLIQVLSEDEIDPLYDGRVNLIDSEAQALEDDKNLKIRITRSLQSAYSDALNDYYKELKDFANSRGCGFITVSCKDKIENVLFKRLLEREVIQ